MDHKRIVFVYHLTILLLHFDDILNDVKHLTKRSTRNRHFSHTIITLDVYIYYHSVWIGYKMKESKKQEKGDENERKKEKNGFFSVSSIPFFTTCKRKFVHFAYTPVLHEIER